MASVSSTPPYKVYKRRFWGLAQLVLLNIVVSWDVCMPPDFPILYIPRYIQVVSLLLTVYLDLDSG
jgi:hypothetical protein